MARDRRSSTKEALTKQQAETNLLNIQATTEAQK